MFIKLFTQILDSSIADDRRLRHFFTDILLCSDAQGFVMMTEAAIARRIGASIDEVKWGIEELLKPDPRSKTPDNEGRRLEIVVGSGYGWRIINFESYKALKSADDMREKTRERVRRFRDKSKELEGCNADVTQCNASNTIKRKRKSKNEEEEPPNLQGGNNKSKGSIEELKAFALKIGLPESDGESMFHHWESNGWKNGSSACKNWQSGIQKWKSQGWLPSQKNPATGKPKATATTSASQYGI